jgi:hypothetical protein
VDGTKPRTRSNSQRPSHKDLQFLQSMRVTYPFLEGDPSLAKIYVLQHHPVEDLGTIACALEGAALDSSAHLRAREADRHFDHQEGKVRARLFESCSLRWALREPEDWETSSIVRHAAIRSSRFGRRSEPVREVRREHLVECASPRRGRCTSRSKLERDLHGREIDRPIYARCFRVSCKSRRCPRLWRFHASCRWCRTLLSWCLRLNLRHRRHWLLWTFPSNPRQNKMLLRRRP